MSFFLLARAFFGTFISFSHEESYQKILRLSLHIDARERLQFRETVKVECKKQLRNACSFLFCCIPSGAYFITLNDLRKATNSQKMLDHSQSTQFRLMIHFFRKSKWIFMIVHRWNRMLNDTVWMRLSHFYVLNRICLSVGHLFFGGSQYF